MKYKGKVSWYKPELGFGFIGIAPSLKREFNIPADKDLFVHAGALLLPHPKTLRAEDRVEFDVQVGSKGPRAINVRVVSHAPGTPLPEPLEHVRD